VPNSFHVAFVKNVRINLPAAPLLPGAEQDKNALLRRDVSARHQLLIDRERRYPAQVFYVSPCLRDRAESYNSHNIASVVSNARERTMSNLKNIIDDTAAASMIGGIKAIMKAATWISGYA
jgi:hypothetical protein